MSGDPHLSRGGLREHYLDHIATLNERRFVDLPAFVADELVYNERPITAGEYRQLLEDDVRRVPDLFYDVQRPLVDEHEVACLIQFDCTPVETFRNLRPTGSRITFTEHVFYRFRGDQIVRVWSLLDVAALQRQLAP